MKSLVPNGEDITIVGVVQPAEGPILCLSIGVGYLPSLTEHGPACRESEIVQSQLADSGINVFTNEAFGADSDSEFDMGFPCHCGWMRLKMHFSFDAGCVFQVHCLVPSAFLTLSMPRRGLDLSGMIDFDCIQSGAAGHAADFHGRLLAGLAYRFRLTV